MASSRGESYGSNRPEELATGTKVGRYRVTEKIRAGGMGVVYRAEDPELDRTVAIKLLPEYSSVSKQAAEQFQREAKVAASFNHPNLVTIHDIGEHRGRPFFAMEYIEGESLREKIDRGPIDVDETISIARQLCEGLAEAHRCGLIHRDLNPANVILELSGRVRVLDFGLATVRDAGAVSDDDARSGTLGYMAPEQLNEGEITEATDLFSLGVVLYEMLAGRRPFEGDYEASLIYAIVNDKPAALGETRPDLPGDLLATVNRLLEKDPSARYQRAADVIDALEPAGNGLGGAGKGLVGGLRAVIWLLIALIIVSIGKLLLFPDGDLDEPPVGRRMLAVLPFENLGAVEDDYFADGVADAITTYLARIGGVGVVSQSSSREYRGSDKRLMEIGRELGCQLLITGRIYWDKTSTPNRVRVDARLVNAVDDTHLWAESYARELEDIFALQSEIAAGVASALELVIRESDRHALLAPPTDDLEAYDFYLRGNLYFNRSWERDDIEIATAMYQRATELDPDFALAYAMLARGHESMYWEYYDHTDERKALSLTAVEQALRLQPDLLEGHLGEGYYYFHCELNYERALRIFAEADARWPDNAELISALAAVQRRIRPIETAIENFVRASELDPRSHLKLFDVALTYSMMREYDLATEYLDRSIALAPDVVLSHVYKAWLQVFRDGNVQRAAEILDRGAQLAPLNQSHYYWWLARIVRTDFDAVLAESRPGADTVVYYLHCAQLNRLMNRHEIERAYADSARVILKDRVAAYPDNARFHSHLALAYAGLRRKAEAIEHADRAMALLPTSRDAFDPLFYALNRAETLVILEEYDAAMEQLRFLLSIPGFISSAYLPLDPLWAPLHNHPGWSDLIAQVDGG